MKILYLSVSYVPSRRASSVHVMKMCAALARQGHAVTLATKRSRLRQEPGVEDDYRFYGVERGFEIVKVARPGFPGGGLIYAWGVRRLVAGRASDHDLVYARDAGGALAATRLGRPVVYESHGLPESESGLDVHRELLRAPSLRRLVLISEGLLEEYERRRLPLPGDRVVIAHDGADPLPGGAASADPLGDAPRPRIGYVGHFYPGRGIEVIEELARRRPEWHFHLVGGARGDAAATSAANLTRHGFVAPADLGSYYAAFDVVLMPYQERVLGPSRRSDSSHWMSPMKMFEYMAAGCAIVSSDLPVLREVLSDGQSALLVPPADVSAWEEAIASLVNDEALRSRLGRAAQELLLREFTWDARARKVLREL